jgi:hypothetical protein
MNGSGNLRLNDQYQYWMDFYGSLMAFAISRPYIVDV